MKITFEGKSVYGEDVTYLKIKTKIYSDNITTNFHNREMPKEKAPCKCLSTITIDSVKNKKKSITLKANKKYYPRTLLEECKYTQEKIKI